MILFMRFPNSFLEELKDRLHLTDVVKTHVTLKSKGRGEYLGLCPFHKEKTPSFTVNNDKQFYHCFGCGAHGDMFKFLSDVEGISFFEAVERLAQIAGMPLPEVSEEIDKKEKRRLSLYEVMEKACSWFEQQLHGGEGAEALSYLGRRQVSSHTQSLFRLGYAPAKRNSLKVALQSMGIPEQDLLDVGLVIKNDQGEIYDRFRGRVMFPIANAKGQIVAFGGRILGEGQPKYLNSPETTLFHKSSILFNEHLVRQKAYKTNRLVVAEGYMDVIAMHQAGIPVAVAPLGTALTEEQLQRLWRIVKEPVICLDGDNAGKRAMERVASMALAQLQPGNGIRFAMLPQGEDPDDVIRQQGVGALRMTLKNAMPLSEALWKMSVEHYPPTTPEAVAALDKALQDHVRTIKDENIRNIFSQYFRQKIWECGRDVSKNVKKDQKPSLSEKQSSYADLTIEQSMDSQTIEGLSSWLLLMVVHYPVLLEEPDVEDTLVELTFPQAFLDKIRSNILEMISLGEDFSDKLVLSRWFEQKGLIKVLEQFSSIQEGKRISGLTDKSKIKQMWDYILLLYRKAYLKKECDILGQEFSLEAEEKVRLLLQESDQIERDIRQMEAMFGNEQLV